MGLGVQGRKGSRKGVGCKGRKGGRKGLVVWLYASAAHWNTFEFCRMLQIGIALNFFLNLPLWDSLEFC